MGPYELKIHTGAQHTSLLDLVTWKSLRHKPVLAGTGSQKVRFQGLCRTALTAECSSCFLPGRLVSVEGIVTKASVVRPKWVRSVHYCPATGTEQTREYRDVTAMSGAPTTTVFPQRDDEGNLLETQYGRSVFRDQQVWHNCPARTGWLHSGLPSIR